MAAWKVATTAAYLDSWKAARWVLRTAVQRADQKVAPWAVQWVAPRDVRKVGKMAAMKAGSLEFHLVE